MPAPVAVLPLGSCSATTDIEVLDRDSDDVFPKLHRFNNQDLDLYA